MEEWLSDPTKDFSIGQREAVQRGLLACKMEEKNGPAPPRDPRKRPKRDIEVVRALIRKTEARESVASRPDWMKDPSLLPKKPPGRT